MRSIAFALLTFVVASALAQSTTPGCVADRYGNVQCPPPGGSCLKDIHDEVRCSPPDGGIFLDRYRNAVCGPGQCIVDRLGEVMCSREAKGSAALDRTGDAVCTGGCVRASAASCAKPSK